ncbi:MAG: sigma 54-interacting transcriptional regulator [Desulfobacterium sp.]
MPVKQTHEKLQQRIHELEEKIKTFSKLDQTVHREYEKRLKFEKLLTELSVTFIKIPAEEVDDKVEEVLQRIGEILEFDRVDFIQYIKETKQVKITHSWTMQGGKRYPPIIADDYYPWFIKKTKNGENLYFTTDDLPEEGSIDKRTLTNMGIKSGLLIPYVVKNVYYGTILFESHTHYKSSWVDEYSQRLKLVAEVIVNALLRKQTETELQKAFSKIQLLKNQLQKENIYLCEEIKTIKRHNEIIGDSNIIKEVLKKIEYVAETNSTVLILGETGTGKELVARAIHDMSLRKKRAMVTVNCAALPASLIESELFGREKGAYTGAISKQPGRFEMADESSIFLDEIGELPLELQAKLLRVLQQGQFERLGSSKTTTVNVRVIAATNRNLKKEIKNGKFREDLYYRLDVYPIRVPALRERKQDILPLIWLFIKEFSETMGKPIDTISRTSLESIKNYAWPGNVRELRNVVERSMIVCRNRSLSLEVPESVSSEESYNPTLEAYQKRYILKILKKTGWRIRGEKGTAKILGIKPTTLYSRMKKLGIKRPD